MKKGITTLTRFSNVIIASGIIFLVGGLTFFYNFPFNFAEFKKINIIGQANAGELLQYKIDFCRYVPKGTDLEVNRYIIAKDKNLTSPIQLSSNPSLETLDGITGCRTSEPVKIPIEVSVPAGEYQLLVRAKYCLEVTIFQRCITVEQKSEYFMINKISVERQLSVIYEQLDSIQQSIGVPRTNTQSSTANVITIPQATQQSNVKETIVTPQQPQQAPEQAEERPQGIIETTQGIVTNLLNIIRI